MTFRVELADQVPPGGPETSLTFTQISTTWSATWRTLVEESLIDESLGT